MNLIERYLKGETEIVYKEIEDLKQDAFNPGFYKEVEMVLTETFQRVAYNLDQIYIELQKTGYRFKTEFNYNFERPLHKPLSETELLLTKLEDAVSPFGFVPLSLKFFYKIVGGVNFAWDYETEETLMWDMADPIQIASLDAMVETVTDKYWKEEMEENIADEDISCFFLELSADEFHKDNISGGPPYSLQITSQPSIDSPFLNERHQTTFINYLRICFDNCGFPGIARQKQSNDFRSFFERVKPLLKKI